MEAGKVEAGTWVAYVWSRREFFGLDQYGLPAYRVLTRKIYGKVVAILPGGNVDVEHWEAAKITRQSKVFGHRIDHSPYRVGGIRTFTPEEVALVPASYTGLIRQLEGNYTSIMRLPTKAARDAARRKRKAS